MASPEAYTPSPGAVDRIETHASVVFLAGDRAYKIKRAVKYPFLDFSTLAKRHEACLNELAINRRTAPQLYLQVVPITIDENGEFRLGIGELGIGERVVEWAVEMRRFEQAKLYDHMAAEGLLALGSMPILAGVIAAFHRSADRWLTSEQAVQPLAQVLDDNVAAFAGKDDVISPDQLAAFAEASRRALASLAPLLRARAQGGYLRHCHGDLHLRNIVEIDGAPVLFDALEFDDRLATIDVLYDLAFLLMDLGARGFALHANAVLNAYLDAAASTGNLIGLAALPFFLSTRAMIRAKVELLRSAHGLEDERIKAWRWAGVYSLLARYYLQPEPPRLIAIGGLSGSGKSTVARMLAPRIGSFPGAVHVRSDVERKILFGVRFDQKLPETAYAPEITDLVYATCRKRAGLALEGGQTVIVDAVHARQDEREAIAELAASRGVAFTGLWLDAPRAVLRERVGARKGDVSDATPQIVDRQLAFDIGRQNFATIDASKPLEQVIEACLERIGEQPART
jgi:aminoglycoside phosphotransferase family enzyme/predicted kinase